MTAAFRISSCRDAQSHVPNSFMNRCTLHINKEGAGLHKEVPRKHLRVLPHPSLYHDPHSGKCLLQTTITLRQQMQLAVLKIASGEVLLQSSGAAQTLVKRKLLRQEMASLFLPYAPYVGFAWAVLVA
jgi:hypothetical protein